MTASNKRKFSEVKDEAEVSDDCSLKKQKNGKKRGRGSNTAPWTPEQDAFLADILGQQGEKKKWPTVVEMFNKKYPDAKKTYEGIRSRYRFVLKDNNVDLMKEEKISFKKAVNDIQNHRVLHEAIAWRFSQISKESKPMNKSAVGKLMKAMKSWDVEGEQDQNGQAEDAQDGFKEDESE